MTSRSSSSAGAASRPRHRPHRRIYGLFADPRCSTIQSDNGPVSDPYASLRARMISEQIRARGVHDPRVLDAMTRVPRHLFVPPEHMGEAYEDHPVAIGHGQTISQPYIVAFMTEGLRLQPSHRV